ncbi:unnamed protein product [Moneuplotes crassus]|uniref:SCP domain-containing protein n=1 Tax=Euplotes crassus TaxID=5936 RepID=A0AAD1UDX6_EUPCR|nr:unnamed protein product [Moneuplotes crassus]
MVQKLNRKLRVQSRKPKEDDAQKKTKKEEGYAYYLCALLCLLDHVVCHRFLILCRKEQIQKQEQKCCVCVQAVLHFRMLGNFSPFCFFVMAFLDGTKRGFYSPNSNVSQTNSLTMNSLVNKMNSNFKPLGTPGFQGPINSSNNINDEHDLLDPYGSNLKPIFKSKLFTGDKLLLLCEEKVFTKASCVLKPGSPRNIHGSEPCQDSPKDVLILSELESRYTDDEHTCISDAKIKTIEGVSALEQSIENFQQREPVMPLEWNKDLTEATKDHVKGIGTNGLLSHESSSGLGIYDRIFMSNDNQAVGMWAENIVFEVSDPVEIVALMLIDDGDSTPIKWQNKRNDVCKPEGIALWTLLTKLLRYHSAAICSKAT